jgi:Flp pilus assembly pilin Flp
LSTVVARTVDKIGPFVYYGIHRNGNHAEPLTKGKIIQMLTMLIDDSGQGLVEYSLVIALVSVTAIAALKLIGKKASNTLSNAASFLK